MQLLQQIPLAETEILPALVADYIAGKPAIRHLYKYTPHVASFKQVLTDKQNDKTDRRLLVDVLTAQYKDIPTTEVVTSNIESLLSENTFTIVAAHQPCLFFGPLYNIYKVACAISLAAELKRTYPAYNFVPVFWMGSEDHDMDELNHTYVNGKKLQWAENVSGAVGRVNSSVVAQPLQQLKELIGHHTEIVKVLDEGLMKYKTFGKLTQYLVNEIFKAHGLVVLDQDDKQLKQKFNEVILDEVLNGRAVEILKPAIDFLEENYKAQAKPRDINFFYLGDGFRERIIYNADKQAYTINNRSETFSKNALVAEINTHPENFSPNVIFRPLYQEMILPNLAFVGGAGELSYWLELKPLFDYYRVNYPVLSMRNSAAILNSSAGNKMQKLGLKAVDFLSDIEALIKEVVVKHAGDAASLNGYKEEVAKVFDGILLKAQSVDVTLGQSVAAEKQKALNMLENIEAKMLKAEKRKQETTVNQIRSIHAVLFPEGTLQERRENFTSFYNEQFVSTLINSFRSIQANLFVFEN